MKILKNSIFLMIVLLILSDVSLAQQSRDSRETLDLCLQKRNDFSALPDMKEYPYFIRHATTSQADRIRSELNLINELELNYRQLGQVDRIRSELNLTDKTQKERGESIWQEMSPCRTSDGEYDPYLDFSLDYLENIGLIEYNPRIETSFTPERLFSGFDVNPSGLLSIAAGYSRIEPNEILGSSRDFRYQGGLAKFLFPPPFTVNEHAEIFHLNNMGRLEFLKYLLDAGFVPLSPYIDFANYFQVEHGNDQILFRPSNNDSNEVYPTITAMARLQSFRSNRPERLDFSPVSFIRLALFNELATPEFRDSSIRFVSYDTLKRLFNTFSQYIPIGYREEDFTSNDFRIFGQFVRDMGYIPRWPDGFTQRRVIKDVTDETFEKEVIEVSKDQPVLVYLYASWCSSPQCEITETAIEDLTTEFEKRGRDITIARVYASGNPKIVENFSKNVVPAFMTYYDGQPLYEIRGSPIFEVHWRTSMRTVAPYYMTEDELKRYATKEYLKRELIDPLVDLYHWRDHRRENDKDKELSQ